MQIKSATKEHLKGALFDCSREWHQIISVACVVTKQLKFDSAIKISVAAALLFSWAPALILQDLNKEKHLD